MHNVSIKCPECGASISVDDSLKKFAHEEAEEKIREMKKALQGKEKEFLERELQIKTKEDELDLKVKDELAKQLKSVEKQAELKASKKIELQMKDLEEQLKEKSSYLQKSQTEQLEMLKKVREVEEKEKILEIEIASRVEVATKKAEEVAQKMAADKFKLEILQKDKKIQELKDHTEEQQRKLAQGSQQTQGEVVEEEFERQLRNKYPADMFNEVPKGIDGADLVQIVRDNQFKRCGTILWEFKNSKTFSSAWVSKLREDQRKAGADVAILVTRTLGKDAEEIELIDGVYVVSFDIALPFCTSLRKGLEDLNRSQLVSTNKDAKMTLIYDYLTGGSFKQKFKSIVNSYRDQKELLEQEKKSLTRIWAKREKQLDIIIESATSMYGDVEGIIGSDAPVIEELVLPELEMEQINAEDLL